MPEIKVYNRMLHYQEAGSGPALVCLHGISSNSGSWEHQLSGLSDQYRVIAWDAPGYGKSEDPTGPVTMHDLANDLAGLLDALGLERVVVIGLSMGGVIAQEFYHRYGSRVRGLVLADTNTGGGARPAPERRRRLEARLSAVETLTPAELARQRTPALLSGAAPAELRHRVEQMIAEIHPLGYRYAAIALDGADEREVLPAIRVPVLVLWGEHDSVTPREEAEAIYRMVPGARFEVISGAGHLSNLEQPAAFNRAVRAFLPILDPA